MNMKLCVILLTLTVICQNTYAGNTSVKYHDRLCRTDTLSWDSLQTYLSTADLTGFYGHPVDSFLTSIPNTIMYNKVAPCRNDRAGRSKACILYVQYYAIMTLEIYVLEFTHMNPFSTNGTWNDSLFRQEKIHMIRVYKKYDCVNGNCD